MLKNRIIPCLDVKDGRVVKGINFVELKDAGDPVEQAKIYSDSGADEICFLKLFLRQSQQQCIEIQIFLKPLSQNQYYLLQKY